MKLNKNAGTFKHRISFLRNEITRDDEGFKKSSLTHLFTTRCSVLENSVVDNKRSTNKRLDSSQTAITVLLRYDSRVSKEDIVEFRGEKYRIKTYTNVDYVNRWLKLVIQHD